MLRFYSAVIILLFLFISSAYGQLKEKAEELHLLLERKVQRDYFRTNPEIRIIPSAVIDSSLYQEWFFGNWVNSESTIYTYNKNLTEEIFIFRRFSNNTWNPEVRTTRLYDEMFNLTREIIELYNNIAWSFARQKFVTYSDGLLTGELYQDWNGEDWVNANRFTSYYDENKNQVGLLVENWAGIWVNSTRYTMEYNGNNNNTLLLAENWISGWQNLYKTEKVYNEYDLLILQTYYQWQQSRWQPVEKVSCSYSERGELTESKLQLYIENEWVNELLTTYMYDSLMFSLAEATDQRWNAAAGEWMNELHYIYNRVDGSNESIVQVWDDDKWVNNFRTVGSEEGMLSVTVSMVWEGVDWVNSARFVTVYKQLTSLKEPPAPAVFCLEQNYPNPFNPSTTITYRLAETQHVTLKIYNILGEEISTLVNETISAGKHRVNFNAAAGLSSGIYLYRLETKGFTETKGMILVK